MGNILKCIRRNNSSSDTGNNTAGDPLESDTNREDDDLSNYMYQNLESQVVGKLPGQLRGEDFIIDNCKNCRIYLLDHNAAVTIDDCNECVIFIGPCKGSVFIRDCVECVLIVSCQQLRTRDCKQCTLYLHCTTQPVIEASSEMRFGCFQCHYPELKGQLESAGLSSFNNNWYSVHNFTPQVEDSWSVIQPSDDPSISERYSPPIDSGGDLCNVQMTFDPSASDVPLTVGHDNAPPCSESCLVAFSNSKNDESIVLDFTRQLAQQKVTIIVTKQIVSETKKATIDDLFSGNKRLSSFLKGQIVFLEIHGPECVNVCSRLLSHLPSYCVYWSMTVEQGNQDTQHFHQLNDQKFGL